MGHLKIGQGKKGLGERFSFRSSPATLEEFDEDRADQRSLIGIDQKIEDGFFLSRRRIVGWPCDLGCHDSEHLRAPVAAQRPETQGRLSFRLFPWPVTSDVTRISYPPHDPGFRPLLKGRGDGEGERRRPCVRLR